MTIPVLRHAQHDLHQIDRPLAQVVREIAWPLGITTSTTPLSPSARLRRADGESERNEWVPICWLDNFIHHSDEPDGILGRTSRSC
jgi:hypothetical protein